MTIRQVLVGTVLIGLLPVAGVEASLTAYSISGILSGYTNFAPDFQVVNYANTYFTGTFVLDNSGKLLSSDTGTALYNQPNGTVIISLAGRNFSFRSYPIDGFGSSNNNNVRLSGYGTDNTELNLFGNSQHFTNDKVFDVGNQFFVSLNGGANMLTGLTIDGFHPTSDVSSAFRSGTFRLTSSSGEGLPPGTWTSNYDLQGSIIDVKLAAPEPASLALLGLALPVAGLVRYRKVRQNRTSARVSSCVRAATCQVNSEPLERKCRQTCWIVEPISYT